MPSCTLLFLMFGKKLANNSSISSRYDDPDLTHLLWGRGGEVEMRENLLSIAVFHEEFQKVLRAMKAAMSAS